MSGDAVWMDFLEMVQVWTPDGVLHSEYPLVGDRLTIGRPTRDFRPDIVLDDGHPEHNLAVSRLHCRLERIDGAWYVVDNNSTNGIFLRARDRPEPDPPRVDGRVRPGRDEEVLIKGYEVDGTWRWWRIWVDDPGSTERIGQDERRRLPCVAYDARTGQLHVVGPRQRTEIHDLGAKQRALIEAMVRHNASNNGVPVICRHAELIDAVWGEASTWPAGKTYTAENLRDLVFQVRRRFVDALDDGVSADTLLQNVTGTGYQLRTC